MGWRDAVAGAGQVLGSANNMQAQIANQRYLEAMRALGVEQATRTNTTQRQDFETEQAVRAIEPVMAPAVPGQDLTAPSGPGEAGVDVVGRTPGVPERVDKAATYRQRAAEYRRRQRFDLAEREETIAKGLASEGIVDLARSLLAGVDPAEAAVTFSATGKARIDPASVQWDPAKGVLIAKRDDGRQFFVDARRTLQDFGVTPPSKLTTVPQGSDVVDDRGNVVHKGMPKPQKIDPLSVTGIAAKQDLETRLAAVQRPTAAMRNQAAGVNDGPELDASAIEMAADRYDQDGTMPPNLGRGAQGAANSVAILNLAAEKARERGATGEAVRLQQHANKASVSALAQLEKQRHLVLAFKNTATRNAEVVLQESEKVDRLGSPIVDRWILAGRKSVAGDPAVARLDAAMRTFVNEYARVTTTVTGGGVTSDTARREIDTLLQSAHTKEQVRGVIDLMKLEMANREAGYTHQLDQLRSSIRPAGSPSAQQPSNPRTIRFSDLPE